MAENKLGKHLRFYKDCVKKQKIPTVGLCGCAHDGLIDISILSLLKPEKEDCENLFKERLIPFEQAPGSFWASGLSIDAEDALRAYSFTPLRQTIVLFMAAINNEL